MTSLNLNRKAEHIPKLVPISPYMGRNSHKVIINNKRPTKMKKIILCLLLLIFISNGACQKFTAIDSLPVTKINRILKLPKGDSDSLLKPFSSDISSANKMSKTRVSNRDVFEVCAGPELCPLCWEPVLHSFITDLDYTLPSEKEMNSFYQKKVLFKTEIPNNGSVEINSNATFSKILSNNFYWKFEESQNISVRTILSTNIPFPTPERDSESSFYLDIMDTISNDTIFWSEGMDYRGSKEIVISPFETARVVAHTKWIPEHLVIPFVANVEFISPKMAACWTCNNNGYICMEASLTGQNISDILSRKGFGGEILDVRQNSVVASLHGTFSGSCGTHTTFMIRNEPIVKD